MKRPKGFRGSYSELNELEELNGINYELENKNKKLSLFEDIVKDSLALVKLEFIKNKTLCLRNEIEDCSIVSIFNNPDKHSHIKKVILSGTLFNPIEKLKVEYNNSDLIFNFKNGKWEDFEIDNLIIKQGLNKIIINFSKNKPLDELDYNLII